MLSTLESLEKNIDPVLQAGEDVNYSFESYRLLKEQQKRERKRHKVCKYCIFACLHRIAKML